MSDVRWLKRGLLIPAGGERPWEVTHTALPIPHHLGGQRYRVYFSSRDAQNRAHIGYGTLDLSSAQWEKAAVDRPALDLGELGCFDDNGVTGSCVVPVGDRLFLYYTGWSQTKTVSFQLFSGLAISEDGGNHFKRWSKSPILDRTAREPFLNASPFVLRDAGRWKMWYVSGEGWINATTPRYNIKYAESDDGLHWRRDGVVCIDFASRDEYALGRPCVRKEGDLYRMWFCARGTAYRAAYAESNDGIHWDRLDADPGLSVSASGWDSDMVAYPFVFMDGARHCVLYNGNDYGKTGIGWAVEEQ